MHLNVSGCLVDEPECIYADKFGFSILCHHPEHLKFHAHAVGALTRIEADELYNSLRRRRRDRYTADLNEDDRTFFCRPAEPFGRPLANIQLTE